MSVPISCVCVVTDIADRQDPLISCIEYVVTQKLTVSSFTAIKIKYCISRALYGAAEKVFINLNELFKY